MFGQTTRHRSLAQRTHTVDSHKGLGEESKLCMKEKFTLKFQFLVWDRGERADGCNHPEEPPGKFLHGEGLSWDRTQLVLPSLSSSHRSLLLGARVHTDTNQHWVGLRKNNNLVDMVISSSLHPVSFILQNEIEVWGSPKEGVLLPLSLRTMKQSKGTSAGVLCHTDSPPCRHTA